MCGLFPQPPVCLHFSSMFPTSPHVFSLSHHSFLHSLLFTLFHSLFTISCSVPTPILPSAYSTPLIPLSHPQPSHYSTPTQHLLFNTNTFSQSSSCLLLRRSGTPTPSAIFVSPSSWVPRMVSACATTGPRSIAPWKLLGIHSPRKPSRTYYTPVSFQPHYSFHFILRRSALYRTHTYTHTNPYKQSALQQVHHA